MDGLFWGEPCQFERHIACSSPLRPDHHFDGTQASLDQIRKLLSYVPEVGAPLDLQAIASVFRSLKDELMIATRQETGFIPRDVEESVEACQLLLEHFASAPDETLPVRTLASGRQITLRNQPYGTVVAILPQNAFLFLGICVALHAVASGNSVVLRAPSGCARSAALLSRVFAGNKCVSVVLAQAKELLDEFLPTPNPGLVHYFGGSGRVGELLASCFQAGKTCIADGEGNVWVYVSENADISHAAAMTCLGAVRYNGETCTSVNGIVVHPAVYSRFLGRVQEEFARLSCGATDDSAVGPLFDESQSQWCLNRVLASNGKVLCGGSRAGNLLQPTLVERPDLSSELVREGLFGPAAWITPGDESNFEELWPSNRYPLCAGIFGNADLRLPNVARVVRDGDPSVEDVLEPWGGYAGSGNSPVQAWATKYRRVVQVDQLSEIGRN